MNLDECEEYFAAVRAARSSAELQPVLKALFNAYTTVSSDILHMPELWRVRKDMTAKSDFLKDIGPPPADRVRAGRLNDEGVPMFYGSNNLSTALLEIDATEGDFIQMGAFRLMPEHSVRLGFIGELHNVERVGHTRFPARGKTTELKPFLQRLGQDKGQVLQYIDAFFGNALADPNAKGSNYLLTRMLCRLFFQRNPSVDGLIYPTVRDVPGFNVALKAEAYAKLRPVACTYAKVVRKREFGFFSFKNLDWAISCNASGVFTWIPAHSDTSYAYFNLSDEEKSVQRAWRSQRGGQD